MMLRALMPSVLVVCLAGPVLAEQGHAVSDQTAQQAAESLAKKFETAYNAGNAAEIASLFAEDATFLTQAGTVLSDRQAIEKAFASRMKAGWTDETIKIIEAHAAGDAVWGTGEYTVKGTGQSSGKKISGHFAEVLMPDGNEWRYRMLIGNINPSQDVTGMAGAPPK